MKYFSFVCFLLFGASGVFSQAQPSGVEHYQTAYEQEVLQNRNATHLELLMTMGAGASRERTLSVKEQLDAFVSEIKLSKLMRMSEVKLMKELHKKVHERFLGTYLYVSPFNKIFETGQYNCVSATALFALVLEELDIPYAIQEQPNHVYIMAYPDTKAISVEMTALRDAYYLPARKDVSKSVAVLVELGLTTREAILQQGSLQIYNAFYNTNSVVDLKQLAGIQYFNEAITAANENEFEKAFDAICKTEKLYNVAKTQVFKTELLYSLLDEAKFDSMKDIGYLISYANLKKNDESQVYAQYAKFIHEQLIMTGRRDLADSSHTCIALQLKDTALVAKLNGLYYLGLSEYFSNAYNLKKRLEYAELAHASAPAIPGIQLWLAQSILSSLENYEEEELVAKMDEYVSRYPFLKTHNLFLMGYFYLYTAASNEFYSDDDGENGKKYFDLALQTRDALEDKEVLDQDQVGWLYAEAGSYYARKHEYQAALNVLEDGLKLAPGHERIVARIEIVKERMKK
jgi:hypothetical protein